MSSRRPLPRRFAGRTSALISIAASERCQPLQQRVRDLRQAAGLSPAGSFAAVLETELREEHQDLKQPANDDVMSTAPQGGRTPRRVTPNAMAIAAAASGSPRARNLDHVSP